MEILITGLAVSVGILGSWAVTHIYHRKSKTDSGVALGNVMESVRWDKRLTKGKPSSRVRKKVKGSLPETKKVPDGSIPEGTVKTIRNIVEKVTSQVIKSFHNNEIYFPELLLYQRILKEAAQKIEVPILKYWAVQDITATPNTPSSIIDNAKEARRRLKEMGEAVPPATIHKGED